MRPGDAAHVVAIYQAGLDAGNASFETTDPTWQAFDTAKLPLRRHVAADTTTGQVLGWIAAAPSPADVPTPASSSTASTSIPVTAAAALPPHCCGP